MSRKGSILKERTQDHAGVQAPPPLIYLSGLFAGAWLQYKFPLSFLPRKFRTLSGGILIGSATLLLGTCLRIMRRAGTNVSPTQPTTELIVEGPYRATRNPIYLGLTMLYAGIALLINSLWAILLLPLILRIMNRGVIEREESYLEQKFGERYRQYKKQVARWF